MRHFPIFVNMDDARIVVSGGGDVALAKLRLLLKTTARIDVFAPRPAPGLINWARAGRLTLHLRAPTAADISGATLVYAADDDPARDSATAKMAKTAGVLVNIVDNLNDSAFITPAMVDRDPVCIAIGTEGAAPMLARTIKAELEARLPARLGPLARAAQTFRNSANALTAGRPRRAFWSAFFDHTGPRVMDAGGEAALGDALSNLLDHHLNTDADKGQITLTWATSPDPELLTLKARKAIDAADVVVHDAGIAPAVLDLARREAQFITLDTPLDVPPMPHLLTRHALSGAHVVYLSTAPVAQVLAEKCAALGVDVTTLPGVVDHAMYARAERDTAPTTKAQTAHTNPDPEFKETA